jgi:hypothetical protein
MQGKITDMYKVKNRVYVGNVAVRVINKRIVNFCLFCMKPISLDHCYIWLSSDWKRWNENLPKIISSRLAVRRAAYFLACFTSFEKIKVGL